MATAQSHIRTPLLYSAPLSKISGHNIYLKLDNLQPSGSFKIRGVGRSVQDAVARHGREQLHIVSSSGGNAGLAACTASRIAGVRCTVYCPETTQDHIVELCKAEGAEVVRQGKAWDEANANAELAVASNPHAVLIHPFQGESLVAGNSTLVDEIYEQLADENAVPDGPDAISLVVGGGGVLSGVLQGIERQLQRSDRSLERPLIIATQCLGADAFTQSYHRGASVTLDAITSKATSMGARTCSQSTLKEALAYKKLKTVVMQDPVAMSSSWRLARDHRLLVEIACGAALAPAYFSSRLSDALFRDVKPRTGDRLNLVIIVCGGSKDTLTDIWNYEQAEIKSGLGALNESKVEVDGQTV